MATDLNNSRNCMRNLDYNLYEVETSFIVFQNTQK